MIRRLNDALLELQAALLARSLYPPAHPRIRSCESKAFALLSSLLDERPELSLFAVSGKVIFEGESLPAGPSLVDTLFRMLRAGGIDQITFRRGLEADEIETLLRTLAAGGDAGGSVLQPSPHVRFATLHSSAFARDPHPAPEKPSAIAYAEQAADALPGIWLGVYQGHAGDPPPGADPRVDATDPSQLGDIVSCVSRVVSDSRGAMLPLAPLKRHDEYTFVHTINVAILATALSEALGLDGNTAHELNIAALLHDVGKQIVPREVLSKPGRFTEQERALMEQHPVEGARMLCSTPGVPQIAPIVAYEHHVRADGSGYPRVPRGWRLGLASRIVQMADVFDALRTNRPYRPGIPVPKIVEMMRNDAGTFFDADLLTVFFEEVVARGIPQTEADPASPPADVAATSRPPAG